MQQTQTLEALSWDTHTNLLGLHPNQYFRIAGFGRSFMNRVNNEVKGEIRTERFLVPTTRVIILPESFIDYSKIGVQYKEGVKLLAQNSHLAKLDGENLRKAYSTVPDGTTPNTSPNSWFYGYDQWNSGQSRIMAYGNGNDLGKWTIDYSKKPKELRLSSEYDLNDNIYIEYLSDCISANDKTFVHPYLHEALQYYQRWQWFLFKQDLSMSREMERLFDERFQQAKYAFLDIDIPTIINQIEFLWGLPE